MPEITPEFIALGVTSYVVLLFSLSVHGSAHAWMALQMGDDTAAQAGRITLNPVAHIDPLGTLVIPLVQMLWSGVPLLAWAKATPVQPANFKPGWFRKGHVAVSAAGPLSNLVLALLFPAGFFVFCRLAANPLPGWLAIGRPFSAPRGHDSRPRPSRWRSQHLRMVCGGYRPGWDASLCDLARLAGPPKSDPALRRLDHRCPYDPGRRGRR